MRGRDKLRLEEVLLFLLWRLRIIGGNIVFFGFFEYVGRARERGKKRWSVRESFGGIGEECFFLGIGFSYFIKG